MAGEESASEAFGDDAGHVFLRRDLHEADCLAGEAPTNHSVASSHPPGRLLEALAAGTIDDSLSVGEEIGGGGGRNADVEVHLEGPECEDVLVGKGAHAELSGARAIITSDGCGLLPGEGTTTIAHENEALVATAVEAVAV